ncbi:MAG: immunoglobulin domain-containing protein [Clostridia bacterium]|nr:immunoglobulin domain-containing protein [Clostridia bacterium]
MKKLIDLLIVLMLGMGCAMAECPCADGYDYGTGTAVGSNNLHDFISKDWSYGPFGLANNGIFCLHGNTATILYGQACCRIQHGTSSFVDCTGYGKLTNTPDAWEFPLIQIDANNTLVIDGGFYEAQGSGAASVAIANSGTVILHDAVITGNPVMTGNDFILGENSVLIKDTETEIIVAKHPKIISPTETVKEEVMEGETVTLTVETKDWRPLTYAWYRNGTLVAGVTGPEYSFTADMDDDDSSYYCIVTNDVNLSATSANFELKVNPDPTKVPEVDPDQDPEVEPEEDIALPETGDGANLMLWMGMLLMAGAALITLRKKAVR